MTRYPSDEGAFNADAELRNLMRAVDLYAARLTAGARRGRNYSFDDRVGRSRGASPGLYGVASETSPVSPETQLTSDPTALLPINGLRSY